MISIYFATAHSVHIYIDQDHLDVNTHTSKVGSILKAAGIDLKEGDQVFPDPSDRLEQGQAIEVRRSFLLYLEMNGEMKEIITTDGSVADVLLSAGITILPGDRIWVDGIRENNPGRIISSDTTLVSFQEAETIRVNVDGEEITVRSAADTLGEAVAEAGIRLLEGDVLLPSPDTPLAGLNEASIKRAVPVKIAADGKTTETYVVAKTIGEALQKAGLPLMGLDYAVPDSAEDLPEDGQIRVVRVKEDILTEQTPLPFETIFEADPELEIDHQVVLDSGAYGVQANQIRVRLEDGQEVDRTLEGEWVAREPEPRKIGYGTKIVIRRLNTPDGSIEYWRAIQMWATSYSPSRAGVPEDYEWFGITACGKKLTKGIVAIDNRYIPFHTMMYVPGYGYAEACDIGGGVIGRWIDLGYSDGNYRSWHQYVTVYFLTPVPPANAITWIFP
jgi:uncharacterized protein YabE (DUF348 family)